MEGKRERRREEGGREEGREREGDREGGGGSKREGGEGRGAVTDAAPGSEARPTPPWCCPWGSTGRGHRLSQVTEDILGTQTLS